MWVLMITCILLWFFIAERYYFFWFQYSHFSSQVISQWQIRTDKSSWRARAIRKALISDMNIKLKARLVLIRCLIVVCPLLGLLGTVNGMVGLFNTIAISGNSEAKLISAGIYQAILPTLAGLVISLSAFYIVSRTQKKTEKLTLQLADRLELVEEQETAA